MIRNAEEAREQIKRHPVGMTYGDIEIPESLRAEGYLSALEGEEVRELVEGFEEILRIADDIEYNTAQEFIKVIEKFRASTKESIK